MIEGNQRKCKHISDFTDRTVILAGTMFLLTAFFLWIILGQLSAYTLECDPQLAYMGNSYCIINCGSSSQAGDEADFVDVSLRIYYIEMRNCNLTKVKENLFMDFNKLRIVNLGDNKIQQITRQNFEHALILEELVLHSNYISVLKNFSFSNCVALESLDVSSNQIALIEVNAISGLTKLNYLDLSDNKLTTLKDETFKGLVKLTQLKIKSNYLKAITKSMLMNILQLQFLTLDSNKIDTIEEGAISQLQDLQIFTVSNNSLTSNPNVEQPIEHVTLTLNSLHVVTISSLVKGIWMEQNLIDTIKCSENMAIRILFATNNSLTNFGCITNMTNLHRLELAHNKITQLSKDLFTNLIKLERLDLSFNPIKENSPSIFADLIILSHLAVDFMSDAAKIRQQLAGLHEISLTTTTWNCNYVLEMVKIYNDQNVKLTMNNLPFGSEIVCHHDFHDINKRKFN